MMNALPINFVARRSPWRWFASVLCMAGVLLLAYQARMYWRTNKQLEVAQQSWRHLQQRERKSDHTDVRLPSAAEQERQRTELKAAQRAIAHLSLPWDALFSDIESSMSERVSLLSIEPDVERQELHISAETKDFDGVVAYVHQLMALPSLQNVYLVSHQIQQQDVQKPVRFMVVAKWRMPSSGVAR